MKIVNEMLDKLPDDVWKNKNLKWIYSIITLSGLIIKSILYIQNIQNYLQFFFTYIT